MEHGTYQEILVDENKELHKLMCDVSRLCQFFYLKYSHASTGHTQLLTSGTSTPRGDDETLVPTPSSEQDTTFDVPNSVQGSLDKLPRKRSYGKASLAEIGNMLRAPTQPTGTKEHTEHGRVKITVYTEYIKAASIMGFMFFLVCTIVQQASQVLANVTLKQWGEHNQRMGDNSGMSTYLLLYGLCSTGTILSSLAGTILLFVFCSLRSAKYLHNSVSPRFCSPSALLIAFV